MLRRTLVYILILCCGLCARSQSLDHDDGVAHWEGGMCTGLNNDGYEFEARITYLPVQFVGFRASVGFAGEISEMAEWIFDEWWYDEWWYDYYRYDKYNSRIKFGLALVLRSPRIFYWKRQDTGFYLFGEPGMMLSPGLPDSRRPRWICADMKAGINAQMGRIVFTLGYGISNFSLYSGMQPRTSDYTTHTVYVGCVYKF